jgi:hypothetical protein
MDVQQDQLGYSELEVIGSSIVFEPDDLPRRLSPIYRLRSDATRVLMPRAEELDAPPPMVAEDLQGVEALAEAGEVVLFSHAFAARPHHWLVQFEQGVPPEYLPDIEAHGRLRRAARHALERAATALAQNDPPEALRESWYARRADPDDPLPLLVLIELLRRVDTPPDDVAIVEQDLVELHSRQSIELARAHARREAALSSIATLLSGGSSQAKSARPYLRRFAPRSDFLVTSRSLYQPSPPR